MNTAATAIVLVLLGAPSPTDTSARVQRGLKWLAAAQKPEGHWAGPNNRFPTSATASAGLALLMEGSTPQEGTYASQIRKALAWFERTASADGLLTSDDPTERGQYVHLHADALLFVACAYDVDDDPVRRARLGKLVERAAAYLANRQTADGGWSYVTPQPGTVGNSHTTAGALQALLAVRKAGLMVPKETIDRAFGYFVQATDSDGGVAAAARPGAASARGQTLYSGMAAACAVMHDERRNAPLGKWATSANQQSPSQLKTLFDNGNCGIALFQLEAPARVAYALGEHGHRELAPDVPAAAQLRWSTYRAALYKLLADSQARDGSWADSNYGPEFATAQGLILLQLENGYLPAFAR